MMKKLKTKKTANLFWMVFVVVLPLLGACEKEEEVADHPVEVQFQLLNTDGEVTSSFREGEDIIFDYKIVNKSSQEVVWFRSAVEYLNIFEVTQITPNHDTKVMGTPYQNFKIYATGLEMLQGTKITPNAKITLRMTWAGDWDKTIFFNAILDGMYDLRGKETLQFNYFEYLNHSSLPIGRYHVAVDQILEFDGFDNLKVDKTIAFEVL